MTTNTCVARERHRTTSVGRARDIHAGTSRVASNWNEMVFEPSRAHAAVRRPLHVGGGADSTTAGATGFVAARAVGAAAAAAVWTGASPCNQPRASTNKTPASIPAPPTI